MDGRKSMSDWTLNYQSELPWRRVNRRHCPPLGFIHIEPLSAPCPWPRPLPADCHPPSHVIDYR